MKIVHAAFWTAAFASTLMTIALIIPFWLGRKSGDVTTVTHLHGAFYYLVCGQSSHCEAYGSILESDQVPLMGREWKVDIVAIPILALLAFITCFVAVTIMEILSCRCCSRVRTRRILVLVTVLLMFSVFFTALAFFVGVHAADEFYSDNKINHVEEFPWSLLLWCLALILVTVATILFMIIVCKWHKYEDHFGYHSMWDRSFESSSVSGMKRGRFGYIPHRENGFTNVGMIPPTLSESNLYNFHGLSKSNNAGNAVLKASSRSLYDSPKIRASQRHTIMPRLSDVHRASSYDEFLESVSQRGAERVYGRISNEEILDPMRLTTGPTSYREQITHGKPIIIAASRRDY